MIQWLFEKLESTCIILEFLISKKRTEGFYIFNDFLTQINQGKGVTTALVL